MKIRDILREFAPDSGGDGGGDDGFSEETLKRLAAAWYNGDEDPRVEQTLMAAGWEIGQDEGYDDEPGVFVVQAGDVNGHSFISWPANELRQAVAEGSLEDRLKKYVRPTVKTTPKIERTTNPAGRATDHVEWKVTGPMGDVSRFTSKKAAQAHYDSFGMSEQGVAEGSGGDQYKIKSIGHDSKGDYYVSPSTGKKVYKSGVKRGDHENPKTGEHKSVAEGRRR